MELSTGFIYNVIGIRAIRKEKNFTKKTNVIFGLFNSWFSVDCDFAIHLI